MALRLKKKSPSVAFERPSPIMPSEEASYSFEVSGSDCKLVLASNNSNGDKIYTVWAERTFIGTLKTRGGEQTACKAQVPKDYRDLCSPCRIAPTGCTMKDGVYLLLKHAGCIEGTPFAPNQKPHVTLGEK